MIRLLTSCLIVLCCASHATAQSETVKLKITYNGAGLANNLITVKYGDNAVGTGTTNSSGDVTIRVSPFLSKGIDLAGEVETNNGHKSWSISGMVGLDGSNYAHVKMEEVLAFFSGEMGLSESMLAEAWGLTFSTGGGASSSNSGGNNSNSGNHADDNGGGTPPPPKPTSNYKCEPVSDGEFQEILAGIKGESFESSKTTHALSVVKGNCLLSKQVYSIVNSMTFSGDQLKVAKAGYANSADPSAYYRNVSPALTMQLDRDELMKFIEGESVDASDGGNGDIIVNLPPPKTPEQLEAERLERERREAEREADRARREKEQEEKKAENEAERSNIRNYDFTYYTEAGEKFTVFVEGEQMNATPASNVKFKYTYATGTLQIRVVFEDESLGVVTKGLLITNLTEVYKLKVVKNNKGEYVIRVDL